ncbi:efflux RND transporter periplasmic adaptor subunit [Teredinibacter waterburyi]|uniref:efflux RND transporter periplasmic adaptor subunit n=1 Tax=Teredinibacter waterburyi TaxID=1500538 RepID=UPI001FE68D08|nr:efflux RND transporter periplasmic adaptor subunit [Teredinibacter waterburyi]
MTTKTKSDLLQQLTIDKSTSAESTGISQIVVVLITVVLTAISVALMMWFLVLNRGANSQAPSDPAATATKPISGTKYNVEKPRIDSTASVSSEPDGQPVLNASGYITARRISTVAAEIAGRITTIEVEEGMLVSEGQVLATLDQTLAKVNWQLAKAQHQSQLQRVVSIETDLREAARVLKRLEQLGIDQYSSEAQRSRAQADADKLKAALASAKAELKVTSLNVERQVELLDNHIIRAPFGGVVTFKNAQPGEIVSPGGYNSPGICTIVDMDSLEIEVDVNEAYIGRVSEQQKVVANLDAYPNWDIPASVIAIIPTADRAKATVRVRVFIDTKDARILPDMGVKVALY